MSIFKPMATRAQLPLPRPKRLPIVSGAWLWRGLTIVVLIFIAIIMLLPFAWLVSSSLKTQANVFQYPPQWIPDPVQFQNYAVALTRRPFGIYFRNTLVIVGLNVIAVVLTSSLCAFGFARLRFPGRNVWFLLVLA